MLAWLTAPTELAFRKGNMREHYPIRWQDNEYADVEAAYQTAKNMDFTMSLDKLFALMTSLLVIRFQTYPKMLDLLLELGGIEFLEKCSHQVYGKQESWEGAGRGSGYVRCLIETLETIAAIE
jgi:hypothetical protein